MKTWNALVVCIVVLCAFLPVSRAQEAKPGGEQQATQGPPQTPAQAQQQGEKNAFIPCPGTFPTDLTVTDCRFKIGKRFENFANGSLTDQAMAGAAFYGLMAQGLQTPSEWHRTWEGYGLRVGVRYNQAVAKGTAQFLVGWILQDDPRHIGYYDDPGYLRKHVKLANGAGESTTTADWAGPVDRHAGLKRAWHAVYDSITVRHSTRNGLGARIPAFSRFAADFGSAYGGYAWYRGPENTFEKAGLRAAGSLGSELVSSFYTEYKPEIGRALGALFKRGRAKK
jgi:hypothetical protein